MPYIDGMEEAFISYCAINTFYWLNQFCVSIEWASRSQRSRPAKRWCCEKNRFCIDCFDCIVYAVNHQITSYTCCFISCNKSEFTAWLYTAHRIYTVSVVKCVYGEQLRMLIASFWTHTRACTAHRKHVDIIPEFMNNFPLLCVCLLRCVFACGASSIVYLRWTSAKWHCNYRFQSYRALDMMVRQSVPHYSPTQCWLPWFGRVFTPNTPTSTPLLDQQMPQFLHSRRPWRSGRVSTQLHRERSA